MPIPGLGVVKYHSWCRSKLGSKTLSLELGGFGITVNNVLPGATETGRLENIINTKAEKSGKKVAEVKAEMMGEIPAGHFGKPEDLAAAVAFLVSPSGGYINGD